MNAPTSKLRRSANLPWLFVSCLLLLLPPKGASSTSTKYSPTWSSLDTRPTPLWYDQAKFGIFMHWGLYSVTSVGPDLVQKYIHDNFKPGFAYGDLAPLFTAELFNASDFAKIIRKSGAKYHVLTSKHHEGFTLWPSKTSWNWNSVDVGPHRDLVRELSEAIRAEGVHFGLYHSMMAWFHPLYLQDKQNKYKTQDYVKEVVFPEMKEIIMNYRPDVLWSDGDWEATDQYWNSTDFVAWLYNESPVKDTIVTNDRWGSGVWCLHGDFFTCSDRFNPRLLQKHKWENCMTIDSRAWEYRRNAVYADFLTIENMIEELVSTISCGGNLLMNVGPTHYGKITPIFEERLTQMGHWLTVNGEAVYESKPWIHQNDTVTSNIWYTSKLRHNTGLSPNRLYNPQMKDDTIVFAFVLKWPANNKLSLSAPKTTADTKVSMLGYNGTIPFKRIKPNGISIDLSAIQWTKLPTLWAWVFKLEYLETDTREPYMEAGTPHPPDPARVRRIEF